MCSHPWRPPARFDHTCMYSWFQTGMCGKWHDAIQGISFILLISYCCYNIWKKARLVITNLDLHILYVEVHCVKHNVDGHVCGSSARARSGLSSEAPYTYMACSAVIVDIFIKYTCQWHQTVLFAARTHTHTPKKMQMRITR